MSNDYDSIELTSEDAEQLAAVEPKAAKVRYSGQNFDIAGLVRRMQDGDIKVPQFGRADPDIETEGFQRGFVWSKKQMDRFIESLLLGYPVPSIFLVNQEDQRLLVLDGQQRLSTLQFFYEGLYKERLFKLTHVSPEFENLTYASLPGELKRRLDNSFIQAIVVSTVPNPLDRRAIYQVFERLNSGGTQLTAHEIRIAIYAGKVIEELERLNQDSNWRAIYGDQSPRVRDQELVARILAMYTGWREYSRPLKGFINTFLEENMEQITPEFEEASELFLEASSLLNKSWGRKAVRRASNQVNTSWADAIFVGLMTKLSDGSEITSEAVASVMEELQADRQFSQMTQGATADEAQVKKRMETAIGFFQRI